MTAKFRLLILSLLCSLSLQATVIYYSLPDTSLIHKSHNLNRREFLFKYGTDDTTRALINYWFGRRSASKYLSIYGALSSGIGGIYLANVDSDSLGGLFAAGVFALIIASGLLIFVVSFIRFLFFPRKKLLRFLHDLNDGKPLSKKLQRKINNRLKQKAG